MGSLTVVAVVVAYNRADLLREALDAISAQDRCVDAIVVVDNASSDSSWEVATRHPSHPHVISLTKNIGGAGGFAVGLDLAVRRYRADLVWLMDDDTVPTPTALNALLEAREAYGDVVDILASAAVWTDGSPHPMNTPRPRWRASNRSRRLAAQAGATPIRTSSFVSMLIDSYAVRQVGLPKADFFIWNDDFEFSARVLMDGVGLYVPSSVVVHKTAKLVGSDSDPGDRFYFEVRNKLWTFREPRVFSCADWLAYAGGTVRRWVRTVLASRNRGSLVRAGLKGLRDGLLRSPRPTRIVLEEALPLRSKGGESL